MKQWHIDRNTRIADEELCRELSTTKETTDLVATIDPDGFLLSLNPAGYKLLGLMQESNLQKFCMAQFYQEESKLEFVKTDFPKAIEFHVWQSERILLSVTKRHMHCSQTLVAHRGKFNEIEFFSLIAHDISAIKNAENERNILREQLFQSKKIETVGKLAGGIAHDFNNFLTVIMGYAELGLLNEHAGDDIRSDFRIILDTAQKASRLTAQLLDYSSKKMIEPQILDLNQVIAEAEQLIVSMMGEKVSLNYELEPQLWPIRFDRSQLEQILFNLAVNARDAMESNGSFSISTVNCVTSSPEQHILTTLPPGDYVRLVISDTGSGMTEDTISQIFEPFFTTKEKGKGTGLGLSAVYGAVKQNNSEIKVTSTPGNGATFEVIIPAYRTAKLVNSVSKDTQPLNNSLSKRKELILLVEDNNEVRVLLSQMLSNLGYEVITARDGLEGEALFTNKMDQIDLMISDIVMPGKDGVQLAHFCLKQKPRLKILLMSGHNDEIVYFRNKNQQGIKMLNKPFSPQRLASEVRALLESEDAFSSDD